MEETYRNAGNRIKYLRKKKNYTREYLAELAGISAKFLYEIESGHKGFSADTLCRLADSLQTDANYILYGEDKGKSDDEVMRIVNLFGHSQIESVIELLEVVYKFSAANN